MRSENLFLVDTKGVLYAGREAGMNPYKQPFARETSARTLTEIIVGADVFAGVSAKGTLSKDMLKQMLSGLGED